ncbi:MAG: toll/interleukin-1 receptor domain-containing protein [Candidatus Dadabacteria bacterium]|nr:toll/interleukin-1 receptor domain-containing protein [Candidatus Dadabacteria bacterium]
MSTPEAFISYSWDDDDHKDWVAKLATELRNDGVDTILDQWHTVLGDQLPSFMEKEIRENDYVLIICTPNYKLKSDERKGGVGYEGDMMTAELLNKGNHRKFIPVLARGTWEESAPTWLKGKFYVDLSTEKMYRKNYPDLTATLLGTRHVAPPLRKSSQPVHSKPPADTLLNESVKILGVIVDEVTEPKLDGTRGSALYIVPFLLNRVPSLLWSEIFIDTWNRPPSFTTMHRPGIASVQGAKIILNGTTIEEVKRYHRDTLVDCVNVVNQEEKKLLERKRREQELRRQQVEEHRKRVKDASEDLSFD